MQSLNYSRGYGRTAKSGFQELTLSLIYSCIATQVTGTSWAEAWAAFSLDFLFSSQVDP